MPSPSPRSTMTNQKFKQYIGDSVYADFDSYHIILTTENGFGPSNTIALEPSVLHSLVEYQNWLKGRIEAITKEEKPNDA